MIDEPESWSEDNSIASDFTHGENFEIGKYCVIDEGVVVGDNVRIGHFVLLKKGTRIGNDTFVDSYVRSSGSNSIGNDVTLRFGSTIARKVTVGDGTFISPNVMTVFSKHTGEQSEGTLISENCHIGTNVVIGPNVSIAPGTVVGALSYVHKSIDEAGIYVGSPAKRMKDV
jgi:UDP-2-acetamido-3-amino-2,3-dideoxy-glucuronate N-acetyltransferase